MEVDPSSQLLFGTLLSNLAVQPSLTPPHPPQWIYVESSFSRDLDLSLSLVQSVLPALILIHPGPVFPVTH